jgi:hypothetical protein
MSKHSPGPWRRGDHGQRIVDANGDTVLDDCGCGGFYDDFEGLSVDESIARAYANSQLTFDAPTMLELLGELLKTDPYGEEFRDCQWCGKPSSESHHPDCAYTRALELVKRHGV